ALVGGTIALIVSKGFSGSMHSIFGILAITLGILQVVSSWLRGSHGGKYYFTADPDDPATWFGDHYNMTPRRRRFEAYHKEHGLFCRLLRSRRRRLGADAVPDADPPGFLARGGGVRSWAEHRVRVQGAAIRRLPGGLRQRPGAS